MLRAQEKPMVAFVLLALLTLQATTSALPTAAKLEKCKTEEDYLDEVMHPDLPVSSRSAEQHFSGEDTNSYWLQGAKLTLRQRVAATPNTKIAKNVILFLGDGMGLTTLAAARNLLGGEEKTLSFEEFPTVGLSRTYSADKIVPDSACTATAYLCGIKANYGTIGVNGFVERHDCEAMANKDYHVDSIAKWALDAGKTAGLVTTTRVTHASPAGVFAHTANRDWENDAQVKKACGEDSELEDISQQLIHGDVGSKLKVILGGGTSEFLESTATVAGYRKDGRNLIAEFTSQSPRNAFVDTRAALEQASPSKSARLLGLFSPSHMDFHLDALANKENTQPTLAEMTRKALEFMQANEDQGYFLFVEGGRIDSAHHETKARIALDETLEFAKAVALARNMTSEDDTLIVVTADHSHSFSIAGYPARGSGIFYVAPALADDEKRYMELSYGNGPSFADFYNTEKHARRNPENYINNTPHDIFPSTVPLNSETHGGEDVAVFASGPWSHLFTGVYDQHAIPHMMAYASCLGNGLKACS